MKGGWGISVSTVQNMNPRPRFLGGESKQSLQVEHFYLHLRSLSPSKVSLSSIKHLSPESFVQSW